MDYVSLNCQDIILIMPKALLEYFHFNILLDFKIINYLFRHSIHQVLKCHYF